MDTRFNGICLIVASIIVAASIVWHAQVGRYQPVPVQATNGERIDTTTGQFGH